MNSPRIIEIKSKSRLEYTIELVRLANQIQDDKNGSQDESSDSGQESKPIYSNISKALKILQFMIDFDDEANRDVLSKIK